MAGAARGAIGLMKYNSKIPSEELCERIRTKQSTLICSGQATRHRGYVRIWLGGREEFLREGLRRVGEELRAI